MAVPIEMEMAANERRNNRIASERIEESVVVIELARKDGGGHPR